MSAEVRECSKCRAVKPLDDFYMKHGKPERTCKECRNAAARLYWREHRDEINARHRENYALNPAIRRKCHEKYLRRKIANAREELRKEERCICTN